MIRKVSVILWVLVLIAGAGWVYTKYRQNQRVDEVGYANDGRVFVDVSWNHLPGIPPFKLTERSGNEFDSAELAGQPYVVSFFFSTCPTICRDLNRQIKRLNDQFRNSELRFVSVTVDPKSDTPEKLRGYADEFDADPDRWLFLTGKSYKVREIGEHNFNVIVDPKNHTEDILLVDRWGRYRDRFTWDDPREMKRFKQVAQRVLDETEPPFGQTIQTRNVLAGIPHHQLPQVRWLNDFHLLDMKNQPFFSRDLTGQVWVASFFFSTCPGICPRQNEFLKSIEAPLKRRGVELVSITTDPQIDTPATLRGYARKIGAGDNWKFLTGDKNYIRRVGSEYLGIAAEGEHHSSQLVVVDRWGNVRARVNWQQESEKQKLLELTDQLNAEIVPPHRFEIYESNNQGS